MKYAGFMALITVLLAAVSGCGPGLSARNARSQIARLGAAELVPSDVAIERIITEAGDRMIAETTVKMAFQFERGEDGEWQIVSARLGDRQWIDLATFLTALESQFEDQTSDAMERLALAVDAYRDENGSLPEIAPDDYLSDVLHPLFMPDLIRDDAWGSTIRYETDNGSYQLRSSGPDGVVGSADDIMVSPAFN